MRSIKHKYSFQLDQPALKKMNCEYFREEDWEVIVENEENFSCSEIQMLNNILFNENRTDLDDATHGKNVISEAFTTEDMNLHKYTSFIFGAELNDVFGEIDERFSKHGDFDPADILMLEHDRIRCTETAQVPLIGNISFLAATSSTIEEDSAFLGEKHGGDIECGLEDTISNLPQVYGHTVGSIPGAIHGKKLMVGNVAPMYCTKIGFSIVKKNDIIGNGNDKAEPIELLQGQQRIPCPALRYTRGKLCKTSKCSSIARRNGVCARHGAKLRKCISSECTNVAVRCGVCTRHGAKRKKNKKCDFPGCNKEAKKSGICYKHGAERKICSFSECTNVVIKGGVCKKHGVQLNLYPM